MTCIIVTGGSGFIGSNHIHHLFHRAGAPAECCPDEARYGDAVEDGELGVLNVDVLTYAGDPANLEGVNRSIEAGDVFVRTNVVGTQTLLDIARRRDGYPSKDQSKP